MIWDVVAREGAMWSSPLHGELHANRVAATGLQLASLTAGADSGVVFVFGLLHDSRRLSEGSDRDHGPRAAEYALELRESGLLELDDGQVAVLLPAMRRHTLPATSEDPTTGCCLDADRLNLQRLGIAPKPILLSTEAALGLVDWARQTVDEFVPWAELAAAAGYP